MIEPLVRMALLEDLGRAGVLTTDAIVPVGRRATLFVARQQGIVAGLDLARLAFQLIDPTIEMHVEMARSSSRATWTLAGPARGILTAERVALNYLCRLSGIAKATASVVAAVQDYKARIICTRKKTPGWRAIEKYAVRVGGGSNHRFGLDDAVLIKDNHVAIADGVAEVLKRAKSGVDHLVKIELEVDTLEQLREALDCGVDAVLLDNMSPDDLREAVAMVAGRAVTEASGRITPTTAPSIAATGVDLISIGWLTHSVSILDIGLDLKTARAPDTSP